MLPFLSHFSGLRIQPMVLNGVLSALGKMKGARAGNSRIFCQSEQSLPQEEHIQWQSSETQKNAEGMAHGIIFQGPSSWRQNELKRPHTWNPLARAWHQTPWADTEETRNCMATHSLPMKDGAPSCNVTSEPFPGAYKHTWTQGWAGTLQGDRDVITGNKGRRGALSGYPHAH